MHRLFSHVMNADVGGSAGADVAPAVDAADTTADDQENQREGAAGTGAPEKKDPQGGLPKKYRLKVDKQEEEVDEAELVRRAQLGTAAHRRMQKAAEAERQAAELREKLKSPKGIRDLIDSGEYDPNELREVLEDVYKRKYLDPESLTPEQRRIQELEARERQREDADKRTQAEAHETQKKALLAHHKAQYVKSIKEALTVGKLPQSEKMVKLAAEEIYLMKKAGLPIDPKEVAAAVRRRKTEEHRAFYEGADEDTLREVLGEPLMKRFLKISIDWYKKQRATPPAAEPVLDPVRQDSSGKKKSAYIPLSQWQKSRR
jgi:hypothetical protein